MNTQARSPVTRPNRAATDQARAPEADVPLPAGMPRLRAALASPTLVGSSVAVVAFV
jgi:hypothetical protein